MVFGNNFLCVLLIGYCCCANRSIRQENVTSSRRVVCTPRNGGSRFAVSTYGDKTFLRLGGTNYFAIFVKTGRGNVLAAGLLHHFGDITGSRIGNGDFSCAIRTHSGRCKTSVQSCCGENLRFVDSSVDARTITIKDSRTTIGIVNFDGIAVRTVPTPVTSGGI